MSAEVTEPNSWPFFARLAGKAEHNGLELGDQFLGLSLLSSGAASSGSLHLLDDGLVGQGGLQRQLAGQQKVAAVAVGDFHHVSAVAQIGYVFLQNHFHVKLSSVAGGAGAVGALIFWTETPASGEAAQNSISVSGSLSPANLRSIQVAPHSRWSNRRTQAAQATAGPNA